MSRRGWAIGGVAAGAGLIGVGVGTIGAGLVREALHGDPAVDDGPDDLLATPTAPSDTRTVRAADGTRLNVVTYGPGARGDDDAGDVIVAVHGWTCNTTYWYPQINAFAGERTVITYDQRGHGASELGRKRPTVATLGQDLDAVLDAVVPPGRRAILIGHSMGGMTIMSWAAQYPHKVSDRVSAVVLASTAAKAVMQNHLLIPLDLPRYSKPFAPAVTKLITSAPLPVPRSSYGPRMSQYIALGSTARASHVEFVDNMIMSCPPRARARWGAAMGKLDVTAGLDALTVPTTIVVGSADRLTPPSHAEQMAEVLRRKGTLRDLVVLDGVGHMSTIEAGAVVDEALAAVIADAEQPTPQTDHVPSV
ncbi:MULTISPECIES: alpha/beta hydrolase [unclassified Gordonia (in: high G+C Gram-positive bacteria)]|uniref:alpha/beta fold hydrolase n=1 Tax=unclassified Gordonia (in: high G+C Gram-positive bacteria) TaxID=2657482 RepID=UPI0009AEE23C|nr:MULTISPECIES: alpha/beta hydrolase [unclassified Gordonia (in: high G+C Gram-positive bacteria)]MDF3280825.1 alpha/beta hydrolase [Gordonia sp. N1V]OPX15851.1 alpha/beta hydrolase [Gordonia sp. i37]